MNFSMPLTENCKAINVSGEQLIDITSAVYNAETQRLRLLSADAWRGWPIEVIQAFCVTWGIYGIPTRELVEWLKARCVGQCVEIGSGNNDLNFHLGIKGTDSYMQTRPEIARQMMELGQTPTTPAEDVECIDAEDIVRKMKPDVVIGSWITDRFDESRRAVGGNMFGPRDEYIIERCGCYIHVGNEKVHGRKKALRLPHEVFHFPWLISRGFDQSKNVIYVWQKGL